MNRRIQISGGMLASLMLVFTLFPALSFLPATLIRVTGQGAFLAAIIGNLVASIPGLLGIALCQRFPGLMPGEILRKVGGRWFGGLLGLLYALFFVWVYGLNIADLIDFAQVVLLPETPALVFAFLIGGSALYIAWEGLEPIARIGFAMLGPLLASLLFLPPSLVKEIDLLQIDPAFYHGVGAILRASAYVIPWFTETLVVTSLVPNLRPGDRPYRWYMVGIGITTLSFAMTILLTTLVFGPNLSARFTYPTFSMLQLITLGRTLGRLEMIVTSIWIGAVFVKLALCLYAAASAFAHSLGKDSLFRKMALLVSVGGFLITKLWAGPLPRMYMSRTWTWILGTIGFTLLWPALALLLSLRKRSQRAREVSHG